MARIAIDSSGIVGDPPIFFVGARLKRKDGKLLKQLHNVLIIERDEHDKFIDKAQRWKLKLSAVLIYNVLDGLIREEDEIVIDTDFQANERHVVRYIRILFSRYNFKVRIKELRLDFKNKSDTDVNIADQKTKKARLRDPQLRPNVRVSLRRLSEQFEVLARVH